MRAITHGSKSIRQAASAESIVGNGTSSRLGSNPSSCFSVHRKSYGQAPFAGPAQGVDFSRACIHAPFTGEARGEREADEIADHVMGISQPQLHHAIARRPERYESGMTPGERQSTLEPSLGNLGRIPAPYLVREVVAAPGRALDSATRDFFEARFGHDFSRVRIHDDAAAAASACALTAEAYAVGDHVVFAHGRHEPSTTGRRLLAHELTHVLQQRAEGQARIQRKSSVTLVDVEDLPPEVRKRLDPKVNLPTASLEGYNPEVTLDDRDRQRTIKLRLKDVSNSHGYVDNGLATVRPRGDVWTLEVSDLLFKYHDGHTLTVPWSKINRRSGVMAYSYRREGGVTYPLGAGGTPTYDSKNTPQIAAGARMIHGIILKASADRVEIAELVYTFSGLIAANASAASAARSVAESSTGSRRTFAKAATSGAGSEEEHAQTSGSARAASEEHTPTSGAVGASSEEHAPTSGTEPSNTTARSPGQTEEPAVDRANTTKPSRIEQQEHAIDQVLKNEGSKVESNPREGQAGAGRQHDRFVNEQKTEYKTMSNAKQLDEDGLSKTLSQSISKGRGQAPNIIVDTREQVGMTEAIAQRGIRRAYGADRAGKIQSIRVIGKDFDIVAPRK